MTNLGKNHFAKDPSFTPGEGEIARALKILEWARQSRMNHITALRLQAEMRNREKLVDCLDNFTDDTNDRFETIEAIIHAEHERSITKEK